MWRIHPDIRESNTYAGKGVGNVIVMSGDKQYCGSTLSI